MFTPEEQAVIDKLNEAASAWSNLPMLIGFNMANDMFQDAIGSAIKSVYVRLGQRDQEGREQLAWLDEEIATKSEALGIIATNTSGRPPTPPGALSGPSEEVPSDGEPAPAEGNY